MAQQAKFTTQLDKSSSDLTAWKVAVDTSNPHQPVSSLTLSVNGGAFQNVSLKGICYSPCPLNGSNSNGPNIGDWFWDSFSGVTGWEALWNRDLPNIRAPTNGDKSNSLSLYANTIRVYSTLSRQLTVDGGVPSPWNSGHLFTHTSFLDKCWNGNKTPLFVLVDIPLPKMMFWKSDYDKAPLQEKTFWTNVFQETVIQVGSHPSVLGFVIQNEFDSGSVTYPDDKGSNLESVEFWWKQVENFASIVKKYAPHKLAGMAVHDDPNIPVKAASFMANCPSVDYWGVNTYQPKSFHTTFNNYTLLHGPALKPVILTEHGFPSTTRSDPNKPEEIHSDLSSQENAANTLEKMIPKAFEEPLCLGVYVFEYCDEWWNQFGYKIGSHSFQPPNIYTWYGGAPAASLPNHYWDQDGFGLNAIQRGGTLPPSEPIWDASKNGPTTPIDVHTPRKPVIQAVQKIYMKH